MTPPGSTSGDDFRAAQDEVFGRRKVDLRLLDEPDLTNDTRLTHLG
ncbi:hypothetical protein [Umezawaea endophytica]|uniref:Uncharacterized protein n=1 Tax=Umezawaea endophytica TaxID=1654476 RepID=A0A9X2VQH1_9PSEU|nr:hypothetical protein [Umezawaea endophytica]MCS7480459.1 hypothetical protein [Umezawaea endophytica]